MVSAIDLFAGAGGFSTGARAAGVRVRWAANHWRRACEVHERNHPEVKHACQDLHQADFRDAPSHDLLLASPSCVGHTRARGKEKPHHDADRATAWAVVTCLEVHRAPAFVVENVTEFADWVLFPSWMSALQALGYAVSVNTWDAADCGVPQNRERVIIVGVKGKTPLHLTSPRTPHVPASSFLDFDAGRWTRVHRRGRAPATLARWRSGRAEHGERFVFSYYGNTKGGRSISRPIGTVTTKDRWALVNGDHMRMMSVYEGRLAMGFPPSYSLTGDHKVDMKMLGNAIPPPMAEQAIRQVVARC